MKKQYLIAILIAGLLSNVLTAQENITVEDIWDKREFKPQSVRGIRSMADGEHFTKLNMSRNVIQKRDYKKGDKKKDIFKLSDFEDTFKRDWIYEYKFNKEEDLLLVATGYESIYRHSYKADFYLYDRESKEINKINREEKIQLADFSPNGKKVSYFLNNNLYMYDIKSGSTEQLTSDGKENKIINGAPDWVYEEEFSFSKAYKWSESSKYIAYLKTDESRVKEFNMPVYNSLYPEQYKYKYPKAGEKNSVVGLYLYDTNNKKSQKVEIKRFDETYIPRIYNTPRENIFIVISLNRLQNTLRMHKVDAAKMQSEVILELEAEKYIELHDDITFMPDGNTFVMSHEQSGYRHLYRYDLNGNKLAQLTKGNWEVTDFYGFNEDENVYYYQAAKGSPLIRDVYAIKADGSSDVKLNDKTGTTSFKFSNNFKYYIQEYSSANNPLEVSLHKGNTKKIRVLEDNQALKEKMKKHNFSEKEFFKVKAKDGTELNAWMIKPDDFSKEKEYPVLMHTYGGPGSQTVTNSWDRNMAWWQMLAQKGYIIVSVDNRGTGARGRDFRQVTYGELGKYETMDQISAAKQLASRKYINGDRIGMFGWSYGGYMTNLCLTKGNDIFDSGIAVAPVTNWRYYDTIYTERYNGLPQNNASGYDDNSPINHIDSLKGELLLVHGSTDDNVHFQNTMNYINELISANKQFEMMVYPNRDHSIYGKGARLHLYSQMTDFIIENL